MPEQLTDSDLPKLEIALSFATSDIPRVSSGETVGQVWHSMRGTRFDSTRDIAVCDRDVLVGVVRVEDLVAADDSTSIDRIVDREPPVVLPEADQEAVAWHALDHGESSLAVVDSDGSFVGIIPPERLLRVLLEEHDEDMARLGGYLHVSRAARRAGLESIGRRFIHRIPWLMLGLTGALLAALLIGGFEERIAANVTLALFLPGIVYLADAVGTQTETVIIRGLSVGVTVRSVARREILTGILVGLAIAAVFFPLSLLIWRDTDVLIAVTTALFTSCAMATLVALLLPWLLARLGTDPAFGSGPLATVIQDLLTIAVYMVAIVLFVD